MNCEKIQEWLMTDYLDRELDPKRSLEAERHLGSCPACREFLEAVRKSAVAPFKNATETKPAPAVWQRIQERIGSEEEKKPGWAEKLGEILAPLTRIPKPVFRTIFAVALVAAVVLVTRMPAGPVTDPAYAYLEEQMAFLNELQAGEPDLLNGDLNGYAVILEEVAD